MWLACASAPHPDLLGKVPSPENHWQHFGFLLLLQACLKVKRNAVSAGFLYFLILMAGINGSSLEAMLKTWCFFLAFLNYSLVEMWSKVVSNNCKQPISFKACVRYFLWNFIFSSNDRPSKTMKNVFYFN